MYRGWNPPKKRDIAKQIPFLCPPKYHYDYYKNLISASTSICKKYQFLEDTLLDFCVGELDFSDEFFKSNVWENIQKVIDDTKLPDFGLTSSNKKPKYYAKLCQYNVQKAEHMKDHKTTLKNTLELNECHKIISTFSPKPVKPKEITLNIDWNDTRFKKYNKMRKIGMPMTSIVNKMRLDGNNMDEFMDKKENSQEVKPLNSYVPFYDLFKKEYFESIWLWISDGTIMNAGDYGEFESYYWFCGTLNPKKFISKKSGRKIHVKVWVSHYTDDYTIGDYKLYFYFSDSLEIFWTDAVSNWERFRSYQIKTFDPNIQKQTT